MPNIALSALLGASVLTLSVQADAQEQASFCQRMAAKLPMKEKRGSGTVRAFDLQTLSWTKRWLTGGSSYFTLQLEPVDQTEAEEKRIEIMCSSVPCVMEGPFRLTVGFKDGSTHMFEGMKDERARVELVGTRMRCSDL